MGVAAGASGIPQRHARAETDGAGVTGDQPRRGTFAVGASLFDHAGLELALEDLLGAHVDVISRGGLKPKHAGILADAVTL